MIEMSHYFNRIKIGLAMMLLAILTGCAGYADVGFYDRGRDAHVYSDRGFRSRGIAHPGGGRRR